MVNTSDVPEGPELIPGETWYPRGQGMARTVVSQAAQAGGRRLIVYRTAHGAFTTGEAEFWFWIDRLSASTEAP